MTWHGVIIPLIVRSEMTASDEFTDGDWLSGPADASSTRPFHSPPFHDGTFHDAAVAGAAPADQRANPRTSA
jgi:hypothetical protein